MISKFGTLHEELPRMLDSLCRNLVAVDEEVKNLTAMSERNMKTLDKIDNIMDELDDADFSITEIVDLAGQTHSSLDEISSLSETLRIRVDEIHEQVVPDDKKPLGECDLHANLGYDFERGQVTLTLELFHNDEPLRQAKSTWPQHVIRLFELQVLRKVLWPNNIPGTNLSDYILIRGIDASLNNRDTAQKFIARYRTCIRRFVERHCTMKDPYGEDFNEDKFMIEPFDSPPPAYRFVLGKQMASFTCNLINASNNMSSSVSLTPQRITAILRQCHRCVRGWAELSKLSLRSASLNKQDKDLILNGKEMLEEEAIRYARAADICRSTPGQDALKFYDEHLTNVPKEFSAWASNLENIANGLRL
jgi:hypothetical protein